MKWELYVAIADVADYLLIFVGISGRALVLCALFLLKWDLHFCEPDICVVNVQTTKSRWNKREKIGQFEKAATG